MKSFAWSLVYLFIFSGCDSTYRGPAEKGGAPIQILPVNAVDVEPTVYEWEWEYPRMESFSEDIRMRFFRPHDQPVKVRQGSYSLESKRKPWSSWWYPLNSEELLQDTNENQGPLAKYDSWYLNKYGETSMALNFHREKRFDPNSVSWAGLCTARAFSSAMHKEPQKSGQIGDQCFEVSDLKALLIHTYEGVTPEKWEGWYGQRNDNRPNNIYADIYPDQFHSILLEELGQRKRPVLMDHSPGIQVWSDVIYKVIFKVTKSTEDSDAVDVEAKVFYPRFSLTKAEREKSKRSPLGPLPQIRIYNYRLYGDWDGEDLLVFRGRWMKSSIMDHPDYMMILPDENEDTLELRESANPAVLTKAVDTLLREAEAAPACEE